MQARQYIIIITTPCYPDIEVHTHMCSGLRLHCTYLHDGSERVTEVAQEVLALQIKVHDLLRVQVLHAAGSLQGDGGPDAAVGQTLCREGREAGGAEG